MPHEVPQVPEAQVPMSMTEALAASGQALVAELKATFTAASETMTLSAELQQEANELLGLSVETEATTPTRTQNSSFIERTTESLRRSARKVVVGGVIGAIALSTFGGAAFASAANTDTSTNALANSLTAPTPTTTTPSTTTSSKNTSPTNTSTTSTTSAASTSSKSANASKSANQSPASSSSSSFATTIAKGHSRRDAMLRQVEGDATAAQAVKHLDEMPTTPGLFRQNLRDIAKMPAKELDHTKGAENSMLSVFPAGKIGPRNSAYALAFAIVADKEQLAQVYNPIHGGSEDDTSLPANVTDAQALNSVMVHMTSPKTTFQVESGSKFPAGSIFHNHGERNNVVFSAGNLNLDSSQEMFTMNTDDGAKVYDKTTNNCGNLGAVVLMHLVEEVPAQVINVSVPSPETTPAPVIPPKHHHRHHNRPVQKETTTSTTTTPPASTPPSQINNVKNESTPPAGPNPADGSHGTPSAPEGSQPVPTQTSSTTETTTTPPAQPTIPENGQPTPTEPVAPVNTGSSTNTPVAPVPPVGGVSSTAPSPSGGVEGQGGAVPSGNTTTTSSTSTTSNN